MGGRGTASGLSSGGASGSLPSLDALTQQAQPEPAPAQQPAPQQQAVPRLTSDTGVQDMDDVTLTQLIQRARSAPRAADGRDDTMAQRIADALGISRNLPEMVPQEALASSRGKTTDNGGCMYRTVNDAYDGSKTARQIAHELTTDNGEYGWNYGGGRVYGTGLYFAGAGSGDRGNAGARESAGYGRSGRNPYTIEARLRPGARIATDAALHSTAAKRWALAHQSALRALGIYVDSTGAVDRRRTSMDSDDTRTTMAMLMGYDGYRESSSSRPYYTIFNRGALQVSRGNKYGRASTGAL